MEKADKKILEEMALARKNEAYHRKQMEYYQEKIKILKGNFSRADSKKKVMKSISKLRSRNWTKMGITLKDTENALEKPIKKIVEIDIHKIVKKNKRLLKELSKWNSQ